MKRILILLMLMMPMISFASCADKDNSGEIVDGGDPSEPTPGGGKILIAYFSRWGNTDYPADVDATSGASIIVNNGNRLGTTQIMANAIQQAAGGDVHLIRTRDKYPVDFNEVRDQNHREIADNYLPPLSSSVTNFDNYEIIFIGYPVWATTVPMAIHSFIAQNNLEGRTVVPFCTHDGYGAGRSFSTIAGLCPSSTTLDGLALHSNSVTTSQTQIAEWLEKIGVEREEINDNVPVRITAGSRTLEGVFYPTDLAREIEGMFPLTVTMGRYGGREFYGSIPTRPASTGTGQLTFENGDITYCPSNNTVAIFYAQTDRPNLTMQVIPIGKVTSDLSVFDTMEARVEMVFNMSESR